MKEQLIEFKTAKLAKEKGFDWKTLYRYQGDKETVVGGSFYNHNNPEEQKLWDVILLSAPTQNLLQKWLRDEHGIHILIDTDDHVEYGVCLNVRGNLEQTGYWTYFHKSYEQALEAGLKEALKLI